MDGEWEPPVIDNPDFKGEWSPKQIDNPAYQGEWEAPMIANPKYFEDDKLYLQKDIKYIGIDIWQVGFVFRFYFCFSVLFLNSIRILKS